MAEKRPTTSYFYAVFCITLVVLVMGVTAFLIYQAKSVTKDLKENLNVEVVLKDGITTEEVNKLKDSIAQKAFTKQLKYISKEQAAALLKKDLGNDYLDVLGYNPLYPSLALNLLENYADNASFEKINKELTSLAGVKEVNFQNSVSQNLDKQINNMTIVATLIAVVLLVFAISMIFFTIRLVLFSNRFTIKTMQLFGATKWFIIKPYLGRSLFNGFISGIIGCLLLLSLLYYIYYLLPDLNLEKDLIVIAIIFAALIAFAIVISFVSTLFALLRYVNRRLEKLY